MNPQKYGISQWSARPMAALFASGYFAAATAVGILLSTASGEPDAPPTATSSTRGEPTWTPTFTTTRPTPRPTTTTAAAAVPSGYRTATGPSELKTVLPATWTVSQGSVSTIQVATDPADERHEIRFGGAPPEQPGTTLSGRISTASEESTATDYRKLLLNPGSFHGFPSVQWDYQFTDKNGVRRQVSAFYWEARNVEYVIYGSSTPEDWPTFQSVLQTMKDRTTP